MVIVPVSPISNAFTLANPFLPAAVWNANTFPTASVTTLSSVRLAAEETTRLSSVATILSNSVAVTEVVPNFVAFLVAQPATDDIPPVHPA